MGHRGARHEAPENTLAGIELALQAGAEAIEIDVRRAAGGEVVVIHDARVDRTTSGSGLVSELSLAELRGLDAGEGERIPTLAEVLELCRGRAELFVELKEGGCEAAVVQHARDAGVGEDCLVKSFDHRWVAAAKAAGPELRVGCLLYGRPVDPVGLVRAAGADFISISVDYAEAEFVALCHAGEVAVCAWNCNDPQALAGYRAAGVDWLGTDAPTRLLASPPD